MIIPAWQNQFESSPLLYMNLYKPMLIDDRLEDDIGIYP